MSRTGPHGSEEAYKKLCSLACQKLLARVNCVFKRVKSPQVREISVGDFTNLGGDFTRLNTQHGDFTNLDTHGDFTSESYLLLSLSLFHGDDCEPDDYTCL